MRIKNSKFHFATLALLVVTGCSQGISFRGEVKPILDQKCLTCHNGTGEGALKSGFNVTSYESLMKGTRLGPVVEPGSSESSTLFMLISHKVDPKIQMPPHHTQSLASKNLEPLSAHEIEVIANWIDQGAKNN